VCVVVKDVHTSTANWAKVLGLPQAGVETIFSGDIIHFTDGNQTAYTDCQVAKYDLDAFVLELIQPGKSQSPWRKHLEIKGEGVFHVCLNVGDRKVFQKTMHDLGVDLPYHVGYYPGGSYSYVDTSKALGLELSLNHTGDYSELIDLLRNGTASPLDEIK
jgi:hypothetical protein